MNRFEAADAIMTALETDYSCSLWSKGQVVRVYLVEVTYKSKGRVNRRDNGFIQIELDGIVNCDNLDRQAGTIAGQIADLELEIDPVEKIETYYAQKTETPDDPMERLEALHTRELGRTGELPGA